MLLLQLGHAGGMPTISGIVSNTAFTGCTDGFIITGRNLADAKAVKFSTKSITAVIVASRDRGIAIDLSVSPDAPVVPASFLIYTKSGIVDSRSFGVQLDVQHRFGQSEVYGYEGYCQYYGYYNDYGYGEYGYYSFIGIGGDMI